MDSRELALISPRASLLYPADMEHVGNSMQISRRLDEMVFSHSMDVDELKEHLKRLIIPGDCPLCEWFGRSA